MLTLIDKFFCFRLMFMMEICILGVLKCILVYFLVTSRFRFWEVFNFSSQTLLCDVVVVRVGLCQAGGCVENLVLYLDFMTVSPSIYTRPVSLCSLA